LKKVYFQPYIKKLLYPIYKAGDERELHNYRPISLISSIAKVIEKCAKMQLNCFTFNNKTISDKQFGFRDNMGCHETISYFSELNYESLDKGKRCLGIFLGDS